MFLGLWAMTPSRTDAMPSRSALPRTPFASPGGFDRAIRFFGGNTIDPRAFSSTVEGFQQYLTAVGVRGISAAGLTRPNHPEVAARHGFHGFLPPQNWWPRGAALALLTERLEKVAGEAVTIRNWWRPSAYNTDPAVAGAKNGDHPTANAFDLDYSSATARAKAEEALRSLRTGAPWLQLSLGLGARTTHVGMLSARGSREWHYPGWTPGVLRN